MGRKIVNVSDMKYSTSASDLIVTYSLGSCLGVAVYDQAARVGGMLHFLLPSSRLNPEKAKNNPYMFGDTGIPRLFRTLYTHGAKKQNMRVVIAGGAMMYESSFTETGKRNIMVARKIFWKNNIFIDAEHVGENMPRTLYLDMVEGETWITSRGNKLIL
ncbi:chemotaxis protein CheD [Chitinivibrio alkaliphilus]|uniref:Probable chemoreceptor glutamine deamidase CheD n=1 Tax=Chitinivibrio alkaliphilus ACht1 TaxID=1313304 RepID=U7D822_9BACT|nr:chemotaxis protein CheD [Chitinivibrio alkaliphilus]ERP31721.1 chemotaxis protein CheD [Chitinivibrio alkaliphilus ACht1]